MAARSKVLVLVFGFLGLAWNLFGALQFIGSVRATPASLIASGMTPEQAHVMTSYPAWMTAAFAVGTFGGLIGCLLLLARSPQARPVFGASLAGYLILFAGDATEGVFAALGFQQVAILSAVVAIAFGLWRFSAGAVGEAVPSGALETRRNS